MRRQHNSILAWKQGIHSLVCCAVLSCQTVHAVNDDAGQTPLRTFGYQPLEIYEFANGTTRLRIADINTDGRDDVAFANNYESRIEILLRRDGPTLGTGELPSLDETFRDVGFIIDNAVSDFQIGDIDNDGTPDIVTLGPAFGIEIHKQTDEERFQDPVRYSIDDPTTAFEVRLAHLDEHDGIDMIVSHHNGAEILWSDSETAFTARTHLTFAAARCRHIATADVNGDARKDLLFFFPGTDLPLRIRLNKGNRTFGAEHPLPMPKGRHYNVLPTILDTPAVGCVLQNGKVFRLYGITSGAEGAALAGTSTRIPIRIPLEGTDEKSPVAWDCFDINADGFDDLCVAAPQLSQIHIYMGSAEGLSATPLRVDSLTGIASLKFNAAGDLVVLSPTERILAVHQAESMTNAFPDVIDVEGQPVAFGHSKNDGHLYSVTRHKRDYTLVTIDTSSREVLEKRPIPLRNDPATIMSMPLSTDTNGLVFFQPYQAPVMYSVSPTDIKEIPVSHFRALTENLNADAFALVPESSPTKILVANKKVARMYEWQNERFEIVQQFNPHSAQADLNSVAAFHTPNPESLMLFDSSQNRILTYAAAGGEAQSQILRGEAAGIRAITTLRRKGAEPTTLLIGQKELYLLADQKNRLALEPAAEYATEAESPSLRYFRAITTGADATPMIGLIDSGNRAIEILAYRNKQLECALTAEVFQVSAFSNGGAATAATEPHAVAAGDVNGDGISDLITLVHDKLIIYPGE
ncbi:MAG: VCBS repeat-containing protein [Kiritimatiellae bacterium]|nr:VCBS repeat-containing protein [Kiritimatiellia bacterium]